MKENDQKCLFCGGKTKVSKRRTGIDWIKGTEESFWKGKAVDRYRYQVLCNKCKARGPLASTEQEARDAYRIHNPSTE
jgi:hypothetical protein